MCLLFGPAVEMKFATAALQFLRGWRILSSARKRSSLPALRFARVLLLSISSSICY